MELANRVAVVTGGASGIGAASAALLRSEGARPVTWDLAEAADVHCDVSDPAAVERAMAETSERFGTPSLLVAAAGIGLSGRVDQMPVEDWDRTFAVNARGVFLATQAVTRAMIAGGLDGSIVVIASLAAQLADPMLSCYGASKAAVDHFARNAAVELGEHGIRVNSVRPGATLTTMMEKNLVEGSRQHMESITPLGRMGTPEDLAEAIVGLMKMGWVTGQAIAVDGGMGLTTPRGIWRVQHIYERDAFAGPPAPDTTRR